MLLILMAQLVKYPKILPIGIIHINPPEISYCSLLCIHINSRYVINRAHH